MLRCPIYFITIVFLLSNSCKSSITPKNLQPDQIEMELIVAENYSGFEEEQFFIIKDQEALGTFYGTINRTRKPGLALPKIDFTKEMLLVWCGGLEVLGHAALEVISKDDNLLVQKIKTKSNKISKGPTVSPFSIYKLPLTSKKVVFK